MLNHFSIILNSENVKFHEQARERLAKVLPENHPVFASSYRNQAIILLGANRLTEAMSMAERALKICAGKPFGADHPLAADVREVMGLIHQKAVQLQEAQLQLTIALEIRAKALGLHHPAPATARSALGAVRYYQGEFAMARALIKTALDTRTEKLGKDHPDTARLLSDYGALLKEEGDYVAARRVLEEAHEILLRTLGKSDGDTAVARTNLEVVRMEMGDYDGAAAYFTQLVEDPKTPALVRDDALLNLGGLARFKGDLPLALKIFQGLEAKLTKFRAAEVYNNLAAVHRDLGNHDQARDYFEQALKAWRERGLDTPQEAFTLASVGLLFQEQGQYSKAREHFQKALAIYRSKLGPHSRYTANLQQFLGVAEMLDGADAAARKSLEEALNIKTRLATDLLPTMTEAETLAFVASLEERDPLLSVLAADRAANAGAAYHAVWMTRGAATRALLARRQAAAGDPKAAALVNELRTVRRNLAFLLRQREQDFAYKQFNNGFDKELEALNRRKEQLELALGKGQLAHKLLGASLAATVDDLRHRLPKGVAVADLLKVKVWDRKVGAKVRPIYHYEAFVIKPGGAPIIWVNLGPAKVIDEQVQSWRSYYGNSKNGSRGFKFDALPEVEGADADIKLGQLIWNKLAPSLADCGVVIILTDGELTRLPWGALPGKDKKSYLLEEKAIAVAIHGQQLVALLDAAAPTGKKGLLLGGLAYDKPAQTAKQPQLLPAYAPLGLPGPERGGWKFLPGTLEEIHQITKVAPAGLELHLLQGTAADVQVVRDKLAGSRYLHLATHGYFAPGVLRSPLMPPPLTDKTAERSLSAQLFDARYPLVTLTGRNPLALCGLILSGANAPRAEQLKYRTDGVLSAEEMVDLDLSAAELVVLSACETGLGEVAGGEGVLGLQRAFALAGARSTMGSLWKVDDKATQVLMTEFYKNLWQGKQGKLEALRQAQISLLRRYDPVARVLRDQPNDHRLAPYYWAAFVLAGDWR
jgi:CHAT domain-containing protein/tetratricopeptide (TPR) repeat protein